MQAGQAELDKLGELQEITNNQKLNDVAGVLNELQRITIPIYTELQTTLENLRTSTSQALGVTVALKHNEGEAKYEAAQGTGEDFVTLGGETVAFPVNTVLNRQYSLAANRYKDSLNQTRSLAYMARLAIEQRIGQRLNQIAEPVGPLPAPETWAAEVCSFTGVDYSKLRNPAADANAGQGGESSLGSEPSFDPDEAQKAADPFIGDYVEKLKQFVEFYNIEYPSHEGDDVAVLSLRDDLVGPGGRCFEPSKNLLFYSGSLEGGESSSQDGEMIVRGWQISPCSDTDTSCLSVAEGSSLPGVGASSAPQLPPPGVSGAGSFSWLHDVEKTSEGDEPTDPTPVPSRSVYQEVELRAGTNYFLSWWDMARGENGELAPAAVNEYRVAVYDPNWQIVASYIAVPHHEAPGGVWSERRVLAISSTADGPHRVVFGASVDASVLGSVAIANVQLEEATLSSEATGYDATDSSRVVLSGNCVAGNASAFRSLFSYRCEGDDCFYELDQPVPIDTRAINDGNSKLEGKIARGNFNFRHVGVSLNMVGTGVRDCAQNPSDACFGTGYVEYTLQHDAYSAGVIDYLDISRPFNFGSASIRRAKALASERYITLPIGSADQGLLQQPEIQKPEFMGRPLSGAYTLRIHDTPELAWDRLEDIQLVFTYRYWSRVQREASTK
jgi:hypothetical protein